MGWSELKPKTADELFAHLTKDTDSDRWVCRGQARHHGASLLPKIDRLAPAGESYHNRLLREHDAMAKFVHAGPALLSVVEVQLLQNILCRMMIMQHHGAPTRLLDWTRSAWVALYFACADHLDQDGELWMFDSVNFQLTAGSVFLDASQGLGDVRSLNGQPPSQRTLLFVSPPQEWILLLGAGGATQFGTANANPRLIAQQSCFTLSGKLGSDHAAMIALLLDGPSKSNLQRVIVPAALKRVCLARLSRMNITAASLFPGIDGLGRHVADSQEYFSPGGGLVQTAFGRRGNQDYYYYPPP